VNHRRWSLLVGGWLQTALGAPLGGQGNPNPMDSIRKLPSYRAAYDTLTLITPGRIAKFGGNKRDAWTAYVRRSRERYTRDTLAMRVELRAAETTAHRIQRLYARSPDMRAQRPPAG